MDQILFLYRDHRFTIVLDKKKHENVFHSRMIKPYHRQNIAVKNLLTPTHYIPKTKFAFLLEIIHDIWDPRFKHNQKKRFGGVLTKRGIKVSARLSLPPN